MAIEIERRFLVDGDGWRELADDAADICQGYLSTDKNRVVRVRCSDGMGYITIKGLKQQSSAVEFEYEIPVGQAKEMIESLSVGVVNKVRHTIAIGDLVWQVDEFSDENAGLIIAEVELDSESQEIDLPDWLGTEITQDCRYANSSLAEKPFNTW